jgi:O-methyltransferase
MNLKTVVKVVLTRVGGVCAESVIHNLNDAVNYVEVGWWVRANGFSPRVWVRTRNEVFDVIAREVGTRPVLYVEFGVAKGASIRHWSSLLTHPHSVLHGFDTFEGLPAKWTYGKDVGLFSTGGDTPEIDDPRVAFFKGFFHEVLPTYEWPERDVLVVNMDADLYSSTTVALEYTKDHLRVGSYLYFDEFNYRADELRAFDEFLRANEMKFELVAATRELTSVAFRRSA